MESAAEQDGGPNVKGRTCAVTHDNAANGRPLFAKSGVIDNFLGAGLAGQLLDYAIASEASFQPAEVITRTSAGRVDLESRRCLQHEGQIGPLEKAFAASITARLADIFTAAGIEPCPEPLLEINMTAHRNGGFFKEHVDTLTDSTRKDGSSDRLVSTVYYFNRIPARFSGGKLAIWPLAGDAEPHLIAPLHDRLAVFPSFAPHEVQPVSISGNAFADSRFSINCWIMRRHD